MRSAAALVTSHHEKQKQRDPLSLSAPEFVSPLSARPLDNIPAYSRARQMNP
jgi:hypothetical protein